VKSMMKRIGLVFLISTLLLTILVSCNGPETTTSSTTTPKTQPTTTQSITPSTTTQPTTTPPVTTTPPPTTTPPVTTTSPPTIRITDQADREVTLEGIPETIISLSPSNTEILFALGLGDKVVGVTQWCNYPEEALEKTKIGGFSPTDIDVSIEQIVSMAPDLILATETHLTEVVPKLGEFLPDTAVLILLTSTPSFDVVFDAIEMVGEATGTTEQADQVVADMQGRIEAVTDITDNLTEAEKLSVLYVVWPDPIFAIGGGTLGNSLIEAAGGTNIFGDADGSPMVDLEMILDRNPDVMLGSLAVGTGMDLAYQFVSTDERLSDVNARLNDRVYGVNDDWYGRPGPRLVLALEELAALLHPELFPQGS
jgi:iron complex transport system substrate-binding protein